MSVSSRSGGVRHDVSLLSSDDLFLFNEGSHFALWEKLGAHLMGAGAEAGTCFAVWAPDADAVAVAGDFNGWSRESHPLAPRGTVGDLGGVHPGRRQGGALQVPRPLPFLRLPRRQGRSLRVPSGAPAAHRLGGVGPRLRLGRRRLDGEAWRDRPPRRTDVHLRGAPRFLDAGAGGGQPLAVIPRAGAQTRRVRAQHGVHPRRVHAGDGAPVLRIVGVPGHRLLRPDESVREPSGFHVPGGHAAPGRHRA